MPEVNPASWQNKAAVNSPERSTARLGGGVQTARHMLTEADAALLHLADGIFSVHEGWQDRAATSCTHLQTLVLQERAEAVLHQLVDEAATNCTRLQVPVLQERAEAALYQLVEQERSICSLIQQSPLLTPPGRLRAASAEPQQLWTPGTVPTLSQHAASAAAQFPQRRAGAGRAVGSGAGHSEERGGRQAAVATADGPGWRPASPAAQSLQGPTGVVQEADMVQEADLDWSVGQVRWQGATEASPANLGCQAGSGGAQVGRRSSQQDAAVPAAEQAGHLDGWAPPAAARDARNGSLQRAEHLEGQASPAAARHERGALQQAPLAEEGGSDAGQHAALVAEQLAQVSQCAHQNSLTTLWCLCLVSVQQSGTWSLVLLLTVRA